MTEQEKAQHEALVKENRELKKSKEILVEENSKLLGEKEELYVENKTLVKKVDELEDEVEKKEHTIKSLGGKLKKAGKGISDAPPITRH